VPGLRGRARASSAGCTGGLVPARLLLDENLSERLVTPLADVFPDVAHVRTLGLGGAADATVWTTAAQADRVLVTRDDDFIALSVLRGAPPKVVWLNVGNTSNAAIAALLRSAVEAIEAFVDHEDVTFLALGFGTRAV
jgi:predicted nuclease of predicted toxin-antitoxin system